MANDDIIKLRQITGAGLVHCKAALAEADGNFDKAIEILRKKGAASAEKKAARVAKEGLVDSYIHAGGKVGVLLEVNCETDFVAKTDDFTSFVHDVALHIAATNPTYIKSDDVPKEKLETEREIIRESGDMKGKPVEIADKIIEGKLEKYYEQHCLLSQPFIKDDSQTVGDLLTGVIAKTGENIIVARFARFALGEE